MSESETQKSNIPEFSVQELAFSLKKTIEDTYGHVRVRGELSRVSIAGSGHMYSSLKDDKAVIDAICWKGVLAKMDIRPEEGLEVICTGKLSTYPARSNYQLIIEKMELAGEGALLKMLEARKRKLAEEGLFASERKKPLPFLPKTIGVITSPTGAVIRDIMHRLNDRFPRHVLLYPALVQGRGAAEQVARGIDTFQDVEQHGLPKPNVLIVARGGGSLEDLMPFNEEIVVRAIANSDIPVISAVGHETDTTLCDYVADARAPTPTGAAEIAVPVRTQVLAQIIDDEKRMINAMSRKLENYDVRLENAVARLGDPSRLVVSHTQRLDMSISKLDTVFQNFVSQKSNALIKVSAHLRPPLEHINSGAQRVERWGSALTNNINRHIKNIQKHLAHNAQMLDAYGVENTLKRGFVIVKDADEMLISDVNQALKQDMMTLRFAGEKFIDVTPTKKNHKVKAQAQLKKKTQTKKQASKANNQQSLF